MRPYLHIFQPRRATNPSRLGLSATADNSTGRSSYAFGTRLVRRLVCASLLALAIGDGKAQVVVSDPEHTLADANAWAEQWLKWKQQFEQWEQQYFTMLNVVQAGPAFLDSAAMTRRDLEDGAAQRCPAPGLLASKLAKHQNKLCLMLLQVDNQRYNVLVDLNQQMSRRKEEMQRILARRITRALSSDLGALKAYDSEIQTFQANAAYDMQNAKAALEHYDSLAQAIREQQAKLSEQALKSTPSGGGSGLIGGIIQGVTLKAALDEARHW
jgi:hypothetical protein